MKEQQSKKDIIEESTNRQKKKGPLKKTTTIFRINAAKINNQESAQVNFKFNKNKKKKSMVDVEDGMTSNDFEELCYIVSKRVDKNNTSEATAVPKMFNKLKA